MGASLLEPEFGAQASSSGRLYCGIKKFFLGVLQDAYTVNINLFDWDTYKTFVAVFPFYAIARMSDERLQNHFYTDTKAS